MMVRTPVSRSPVTTRRTVKSLYSSNAACEPVKWTYLAAGDFAQWHPTLATRPVVFNAMDGNGIYQVYRMEPDGSSIVCLTDPLPTGGPPVNRHKGCPTWDAAGDWIIIQAEQDDHYGLTSPPSIRYLSEPGMGWWCDLWLLKADGSSATRLTNVGNGGGDGGSGVPTRGVLYPRFNAAGTKFLWSTLIGTVWSQGRLGWWQLWQADYAGGVSPVVSNSAAITLPDTTNPGTFFESHGYTPDGKLMFTSDYGLPVEVTSNNVFYNVYGMDILTYDPVTQAIARLTNTPAQWDEHSAQKGNVIAYLSSSAVPGYDYTRSDLLTSLRGELVLMDANGKGWRQLTWFNTSGHAEYNSNGAVATSPTWSSDGRSLIVCRQLMGAGYPARSLWKVDFAGACGAL